MYGIFASQHRGQQGHAVSASLPVVARYIMPGLVRKLLHGPELPKVACPGLQVAEEAPDDAAVIVIAVPCPQNEAPTWTKHSNYITCPRNGACSWPKHSDHVPRPRKQPLSWTEFFRFDMLPLDPAVPGELEISLGQQVLPRPWHCTAWHGLSGEARHGP